MCHRISRQFKGKMRISFAGGAGISIATSCLRRASGPSPWPPPSSSPAATTGCTRWWRRWSPWPISPFRHGYAGHLRYEQRQPHRCPPRQAYQAPAQPQERQAGALDGLLHRTPCKGCPIEQDIPEYMELCNRDCTARP